MDIYIQVSLNMPGRKPAATSYTACVQLCMTPCRRRGQGQAISGRPAAAGGDEDDDPACRLSITRHTSARGTNSPSIASTCTCAHVWPPTRSHSANYVPCTRTTASIVRARVLPPVDRSIAVYVPRRRRANDRRRHSINTPDRSSRAIDLPSGRPYVDLVRVRRGC